MTALIREKAKVVTKAVLWKIPHNSGKLDVSLKLGRYKKNYFNWETLEASDPKSELTLDDDEFSTLIEFLRECYEPLKQGVKQFIPIDEKFDHANIEHLKALFANPEKQKVLSLIFEHGIIPDDLLLAMQGVRRRKGVAEFEGMLANDLAEPKWQEWFTKNDWVLGSEFVQILDERRIDPESIADYLMKAYDGFVDIVEIKRPGGGLKFWSDAKDHNNYFPHSDLTKAITQATKYIHAVELEANSVKFLERVGNIKTIKPRCVLIFGRSNDWDDEKREAYRILNASFHNLTILTYDHVLQRAKRIMGM